MRKPLPPVASLSRVIEPQPAQMSQVLQRQATPQQTQHVQTHYGQQQVPQQYPQRRQRDTTLRESARRRQQQVAQAMTRQAAAARTSVKERRQDSLPTEAWYRVEDPYTTAENDAAFARFMNGDNPHVRTDEVPVVDFTSMIEVVGPDGRPLRQTSRRAARMKLALAAVATVVALALAVAFGFLEIPGTDGVTGDGLGSTVPSATVDGSSSNPDAGAAETNADQQPLNITSDG